MYTEDEIKRKIRKLKKLEIRIRFTDNVYADKRLHGSYSQNDLIWNRFFRQGPDARYTLQQLAQMDRQQICDVISEFFWHVYFQSYRETGFINQHFHDPKLLEQMGLPCYADSQAIKKKFRQLAKQYHPDTGGESVKFIELLENYRKLNEYK